MAQTERREAPINIRALPAQRALIDKAAAALKKSRSDFINLWGQVLKNQFLMKNLIFSVG